MYDKLIAQTVTACDLTSMCCFSGVWQLLFVWMGSSADMPNTASITDKQDLQNAAEAAHMNRLRGMHSVVLHSTAHNTAGHSTAYHIIA